MDGLLYLSTLSCADVAELADALDSGSSGHCARAGSSPVIRSNAEARFLGNELFSFLKKNMILENILKIMLDIFFRMRYYNLAH